MAELKAERVQGIDTSKAHPALMYDHPLGGQDHFEAAREAIAALLSARPPGSYLVASQTAADFNDPSQAAVAVQAVHRAGVPFPARTAEEFADLAFAGLKPVPPGLVAVSAWRPETGAGLRPLPSAVAYYGAVGEKPARLIRTLEGDRAAYQVPRRRQ
jgi:hypothetical protein